MSTAKTTAAATTYVTKTYLATISVALKAILKATAFVL